MTIEKTEKPCNILLNNERLEQVKEFSYLGGVITEDGNCEKDIKKRIGLAAAAIGKLNKIWT